VPELVAPVARVHRSFLVAMAEFVAEGRGQPDEETVLGWEIREFGATWSSSSDGFAEFIEMLKGQSAEESSRPPGHVPATTGWWVDGEEYLGRIVVRHRLTPRLLEFGGHIGYDVRPSVRRRGHATAMLAAMLPLAGDLGIDPALLTCDADNTASRLVIEHCGGVLEDQRGGKLRYWVPTS
jgi:predicted acetyltransferase